MKKTHILLILLAIYATVIVSVAAFANCNYLNYCPKQILKSKSNVGQIVSLRTGATFLSEKIAQARIKYELKKATKQNFTVSVKTFSILDLLQGRLKSITISGKNINVNGVYLTSIELKTLCDYNHVQFNKKPIRFKENMVVGFSTVIADTDLMKTMESSGYLNKLNCVNVHGCGITFFKLSGAGVNIQKNKLNLKIKITSQLLLEKPLDVNLSTDLKAENGRIVLTKINLGNLAKGVDLSNVANQINKINPLTFSLNILENKNTKMCIQTAKIDGNTIKVSGNIFIPRTVN